MWSFKGSLPHLEDVTIPSPCLGGWSEWWLGYESRDCGLEWEPLRVFPRLLCPLSHLFSPLSSASASLRRLSLNLIRWGKLRVWKPKIRFICLYSIICHDLLLECNCILKVRTRNIALKCKCVPLMGFVCVYFQFPSVQSMTGYYIASAEL